MLFTTIVDDYGEQDIELFDNNEITKQFRETIAENEQNWHYKQRWFGLKVKRECLENREGESGLVDSKQVYNAVKKGH